MFRISETPVMWLWVDATTGICFPETLSHTEAMALHDAQRILGKRRLGYGDVQAVRVQITPLTDDEAQAQRAEFAAWKAKKDSQRPAPANNQGSGEA